MLILIKCFIIIDQQYIITLNGVRERCGIEYNKLKIKIEYLRRKIKLTSS